MDKEIKSVLDEFSDDDEKKVQLLTGKRVALAEELSKCFLYLIASHYIPLTNTPFFYSSCASNPRKIRGIYKCVESGKIA